jgi:hypothetical protein
MGKIGIKGNSACGDKIIKLLTRLGGVNVHNLTGYDDTRVYYIDTPFSHIGYVNIEYYDGIWYSYVDFMEEFPFVIGDRVVNKADGRDGIVYSMTWDCDSGEVVYNVLFSEGVSADLVVNDLSYPSVNTTNKAEEHISNEVKKSVNESVKINDNTSNDDEHPILKELHEKMEELYKYFKKKLESEVNSYPKTHSECCKILGIETFTELSFTDNCDIYGKCDLTLTDYSIRQLTLLIAFKKLIDCRNAYWKIIGEEMGMGKPWEPDWKNEEGWIHCITTDYGEIYCTGFRGGNKILAFPTEEIRDIFYKNFKTLIETCVNFI